MVHFKTKSFDDFTGNFTMGYVFNFNDALAFERWVNTSRNRFKTELEHRLMVDMLKPIKGESLLDIGCGIGSSIVPFLEVGLQVTGLDPSPYMLDLAIKHLGNRIDLYRGFAEDLPFDDNSFNHASLVTTLEFVDDPQKAIVIFKEILAEISRVKYYQCTHQRASQPRVNKQPANKWNQSKIKKSTATA